VSVVLGAAEVQAPQQGLLSVTAFEDQIKSLAEISSERSKEEQATEEHVV
jgi:hypothetical protein